MIKTGRRIKQYRLRMTEEEFDSLEYLSQKLNMPKSKVIRHALENYKMMAHYVISDRKAIEEAYRGGLTHAAVYVDSDSIKLTKEG